MQYGNVNYRILLEFLLIVSYLVGRRVRILSIPRLETKRTTNSDKIVGIRRQISKTRRQSASCKKLQQNEDEMEPWAYRGKRGQCIV